MLFSRYEKGIWASLVRIHIQNCSVVGITFHPNTLNEEKSKSYHVQNGSGAHPASYPMDTRGSLPGGRAARA